MSKNISSPVRTRNWTFVLYPESAPENWRDIINEMHVEWVESPLHDKDVDGQNQPKKPHIHILLLFQGVKTYEQILSLIEPLNCTIPQICQSTKALVRYFAHLDDPNKHQYNPTEIYAHGGVDLDDLLRPSASERANILKDILMFVRQNNICEYKDLLDYCMDTNLEWYYTVVNTSTFVICKYLTSQRHRQAPLKFDPETGEVFS